MKISSWLRASGVVERNVKDTLDSTINELHVNCPLKVPKESISASLNDIMKRDEAFSKKSPAHIKIFNWFGENGASSSKQSKKSKSNAIFEKTRIPATANNNRGRSTSPPPVKQEFSLSSNRQAAIFEHFYTFVENELHKFLTEYENIIPARVAKTFARKRSPPIGSDFRDADLLSMLDFVIEHIDIFLKKSVFHGLYKANPVKIFKDFKENVRHKMAQGISTNEGRWSDLAIQNVTYLSCHIVVCLGGNYEDIYSSREKVDNEIAQKLMERAATKESRPPKRKINNYFCEMTEFFLDVLEEVEETEKGQKREIMKVLLKEDERLAKIWEIIVTQKSKKEQVRKFIEFANMMFDINLKEVVNDNMADSELNGNGESSMRDMKKRRQE